MAYKDFTAAELTKIALQILKVRNVEAWRQTISAKKNRKNVVKSGVPDILGYNKGTGVSTYCEVKKIGDALKIDQIEFMTNAQNAGCICLVMTQKGPDPYLASFDEYFLKQLV